MDRRTAQRCPVCQGPTVADANQPDGSRCRRSICIHNHQHVVCPRCGQKDLAAVDHAQPAADGKKNQEQFRYTCAECTHSWTA